MLVRPVERAFAQAGEPHDTEQTSATPPSAAIEHYNRGRAHYQAGRYREALQELEVAVNLDPSSPDLVFNVARVYELVGDIDQAIAFYRRYREMLPPNDPERTRTDLTLQRLEGARVHTDGITPPPPTIIERKHGVADATFWSLAGIGAAALVGAGVTGVLALTTAKDSERFELGKDGGEKDRSALVDRSDRLALTSDVMLLSGTSLGITALLMYALRERTTPLAKGMGVNVDLRAWSDGAYLAFKGRL